MYWLSTHAYIRSKIQMQYLYKCIYHSSEHIWNKCIYDLPRAIHLWIVTHIFLVFLCAYIYMGSRKGRIFFGFLCDYIYMGSWKESKFPHDTILTFSCIYSKCAWWSIKMTIIFPTTSLWLVVVLAGGRCVGWLWREQRIGELYAIIPWRTCTRYL